MIASYHHHHHHSRYLKPGMSKTEFLIFPAILDWMNHPDNQSTYLEVILESVSLPSFPMSQFLSIPLPKILSKLITITTYPTAITSPEGFMISQLNYSISFLTDLLTFSLEYNPSIYVHTAASDLSKVKTWPHPAPHCLALHPNKSLPWDDSLNPPRPCLSSAFPQYPAFISTIELTVFTLKYFSPPPPPDYKLWRKKLCILSLVTAPSTVPIYRIYSMNTGCLR